MFVCHVPLVSYRFSLALYIFLPLGHEDPQGRSADCYRININHKTLVMHAVGGAQVFLRNWSCDDLKWWSHLSLRA